MFLRGELIESANIDNAVKESNWKFEKRLEFWKSKEGTTLITGWIREGYKPSDIARKIGITPGTFIRWVRENESIYKAIREGSELNDFRVENALLKNALGYKAKNTTVTTIMRYGKVVETQIVEEEVDVAPNVNAQKVWLYNRKPKQWIPESKISGDSNEDELIEVEIIRLDNVVDADEQVEFDELSRNERKKMLDDLSDSEYSDEEIDSIYGEINTTDPDDPDYWPEDWDESDSDDWDE